MTMPSTWVSAFQLENRSLSNMASLKRTQSRAAIIRASRCRGQMGRGACLDSGFASVNTAAVEVFVTPKLFDRIVQSPQNLIAIETVHAEDVVAQFRLLAMRTGQTVYYWQGEGGLTR